MRFNDHSRLEGAHAFLSPSKHAWINYDEDKLDRVLMTTLSTRRGTELHDLAAQLIRLRVKLPRSSATLNRYVNEAIGYRMTAEQTLFYSNNVFGTTDAILYDPETKKLRIHDLKTGITPASMHQLEVYAALFCLEYREKPFDTDIELRIYQGDEVRIEAGDPDTITRIMSKIVSFDKRLNDHKNGGLF